MISSISPQGLRRIHIGCKLQETAARYQSEGFSHIYNACAGTNTQNLIDLLETIFGELDLEDVNLEQLESETTKTLRQEVMKAKEAAVTMAHGPIPAD